MSKLNFTGKQFEKHVIEEQLHNENKNKYIIDFSCMVIFSQMIKNGLLL